MTSCPLCRQSALQIIIAMTQAAVMTRILCHLKLVAALSCLPVFAKNFRLDRLSLRTPRVVSQARRHTRSGEGICGVHDTSELLQSRLQSAPSACSNPPFLRSTPDITPGNLALSHPEALAQATQCRSTLSRSALADLQCRAGTSGDSSSDTFAMGARKVPLNSYSYVI
jgi:hypothetical protein